MCPWERSHHTRPRFIHFHIHSLGSIAKQLDKGPWSSIRTRAPKPIFPWKKNSPFHLCGVNHQEGRTRLVMLVFIVDIVTCILCVFHLWSIANWIMQLFNLPYLGGEFSTLYLFLKHRITIFKIYFHLGIHFPFHYASQFLALNYLLRSITWRVF